ncbi:MAG: Possibl zinc metallo-peptidase [Marmoricola sp.]|jgi:predicted Zn-dependent protease with MMP-like domain|nr:Possibl zinc metallo-peptidase [Marmoricola sp.]
MRGPAFQPGPLAPNRVPAYRTEAERFDLIAVSVVGDIEDRWPDQLSRMELAVEEIPLLPDSWAAETVPLASFVDETATSPPRLVLFRRPIEHRADTRADLEALVLTVVVEQLADFLGVTPDDVHPDYETGD